MGKAMQGRRGRRERDEVGPARANGQRLSGDQRRRLALAEQLAAGDWRERQRAAHLVRQVEAELVEARSARAVERGIDDTLQRARARGEVFAVETVAVGEWRRNEIGGLARREGRPILDVQVVRRASRIDGLASLYKAGAISDAEKETGDAYRAVFDRARAPMAISDLDWQGGGAGDAGRMLVSVAEAGSALKVLSDIAERIGDARTVAVLEAVAGRGATIRSLGDAGGLKAANRERLVEGLEVAKQVLAEVRDRRLANQAR